MQIHMTILTVHYHFSVESLRDLKGKVTKSVVKEANIMLPASWPISSIIFMLNGLVPGTVSA